MPLCGFAKCDGCEYAAELVEGWDAVEGLYRVANLPPIPVLAQWIWCNGCSRISQAERLPELEEIKRELRRTLFNFSDWGQGIWRCTRIGRSDVVTRRYHRRVLKAMLAWRRLRRSPPRCLNCGHLDHVLIGVDFQDTGVGTIDHPLCGGKIHCELGSIWTGICEGYNAFDAEGHCDGIFRYVGSEMQYFGSDTVFERLTQQNYRVRRH